MQDNLNKDRRTWMQAVGITVAASAVGPALFAQKAKTPELTEEELQKAYEETENLVKTGSTPDRPGIQLPFNFQLIDLPWNARAVGWP